MKHFIVDDQGYLHAISKAYRVSYLGMKHSFLVHRMRQCWEVTEPTTGMRITDGFRTRKEAISVGYKNIQGFVAVHRLEGLYEAIAYNYNDNRLSIDLFNAVNNPEATKGLMIGFPHHPRKDSLSRKKDLMKHFTEATI